MLQGKEPPFGAKPEPHARRRTELGEALEDGVDGAADGGVGMKKDFPILFAPKEADRQTATQFSARGLVADTAVEPGAKDVQLGFAHRPF